MTTADEFRKVVCECGHSAFWHAAECTALGCRCLNDWAHVLAASDLIAQAERRGAVKALRGIAPMMIHEGDYRLCLNSADRIEGDA